MCLAYVTQALDKGTLGPASIMGWQANVGAKGQDFALTSTFLWCGIIAGEPIVCPPPSTFADHTDGLRQTNSCDDFLWANSSAVLSWSGLSYVIFPLE
jgi:hypothetical protein